LIKRTSSIESMKISSILVIVDPTATEHPALQKAVCIAAKCDARLEMFVCETKESRDVRYAAHLARNDGRGFIVNLQALLEPLAEPIRRQGIDVCLETDTGDPLHEVLLERVRRGSADLVVKDTHHHALLKRTFITNTDWHLIRGCPVPLLLTKAKPWPPTPVVVAAIDPGHVYDRTQALDGQIMASAHSLATHLGARLHVLNAFLPLALTTETAGGPVGIGSALAMRLDTEARMTRQAELERAASAYAVSAADVHVQAGVPSEVLPAATRDLAADVLAMGAVSRSGLQRLFIGSTAEQVLEALPCDALVIKSPDFAAALPA
jgi:universal stress protein E